MKMEKKPRQKEVEAQRRLQPQNNGKKRDAKKSSRKLALHGKTLKISEKNEVKGRTRTMKFKGSEAS